MLRLEPGSVVAGLRVARELGRGAFGVVYLAEDELIGRHVALKVVHSSAAHHHRQDRALREARAVGRLKSPHIVTLHRVHPLDDGEGWMLEMEYISGGSLNLLLEQDNRLPLDQALGILRSVLEALNVAHEAGVVHGDVKPGNVLLEESGQVKLADFGLSWMIDDQNLSSSISEGAFGTPMYMAPEVIMGERGTFASDLWSAGVVFYRMLSGQMPFRSTSLPDLFFAVQNTPPPPLPVSVPAPVQSLVMRMLAKTPADRPASAKAILDEFHRLTEMTDAPTPVPSRIAAHRVFGRDEELRLIFSLLDSLEAGNGAALLMAGEAGIGKTALVQTLQVEASRRGMLSIEATATALEGGLRPLLRAADRAAPIGSGSEVPAQLVTDLLDEAGAVTLHTRRQVALAVEQLFSELAERQPVVLTIENAHTAGAADLKLFRELADRLSRRKVLMVITYRAYDVESSASETGSLAGFHELASLKSVRHMTLKPLESEAIFKLIEARSEAARVDAGVAQRVISLSEGNPLFAVELMRHLEAEGAIMLDGSSIKASLVWDGLSLPGRFHNLVACRLAGLTDEQRELLDVAAMDGPEFDGEALEAVLDRSLLDVLRELQRLYRERNLVEPHGDGYRFTNSVVQEVIYQQTAPALRRAVHRKLADHLEQRGGGVNPARLGQHWERADEPERARPHLMIAAAGAARRLEHRRLVDLCERAGMLPGRIDAADSLTYLDTLLHLGIAYGSIGRSQTWERLSEELDAAARAAGDEQAQARIAVRRVWEQQTYHAGSDGADVSAYEEAVAVLDLCVERGHAKYQLGMIAKFRGSPGEAEEWFHKADDDFRALGRGERDAVLNQLGLLAWRGERFDEAQSLLAKAADASAALGKAINACASQVNRAMVRFEIGEFDGTEEALEKAIHTLTLEGSAMASSAAAILADVQYAQGNLGRAVRTVDAALDMVADSTYLPSIEAVRTAGAHLDAVRGRLPEAWESLRQARDIAESRGYELGRVALAGIEVQLRCFSGDPEGAANAARAAVDLAAASGDKVTREEPAHWIAEAWLYGLPPEVPASGDAELVHALAAFHDPDARIAVPDSLPGRRRAALQVICGLLASEAARRAGDAPAARENAERALEEAQQLGHVWLEARLLRHMHELTGEAEPIERRNALILRIADGLDTPEDRRRLLDAWAAPPGSS